MASPGKPQNPDQTPALNDEPAGNDLLGYEPYARTLAQMVAHKDLGTPFTVGIFGPWGAGKSSFMVQIRDELRELGQPFVFFQPWVFDQRQEVWKALILSVVHYLKVICPKTGVDEAHQKLEALALGVARLTVNKILSVAGVSPDDVNKLEEQIRKSSGETTTYVNTFRRGFEESKDAVLQAVLRQPKNERVEQVQHVTEGKRLFVFIDDLDRCTPEGCVMVLEAVKLFFGTDGCVFILGIDAEIVQRGIELKYKDNPKLRGRDYLEKLIQLPFTLPPVSEFVYHNYVQAVAARFAFSNVAVQLIGKASDGNPRRVKRLINCLHLIRTAARDIGMQMDTPLNEDKLALLLILQSQFPVIHSWLARDPVVYPMEYDRWNRVKTEQLVPLLDQLEGSGTGAVMAERFFSFWQQAHGLGVPQFVNANDLIAHLRVSGLAETGDPTQVARLADLLDHQFNDMNLEVVAPRAERGLAPIESPAQFKVEVEVLKKEWEELWGSPLGSMTTLVPGSRLRAADELAKKSDLLQHELRTRFGKQDLYELDLALRNIGRRQALAQSTKVARGFALCLVVLTLAMGGTFEVLYPKLGQPSAAVKEAIASEVQSIADDYKDLLEFRALLAAARATLDLLIAPHQEGSEPSTMWRATQMRLAELEANTPKAPAPQELHSSLALARWRAEGGLAKERLNAIDTEVRRQMLRASIQGEIPNLRALSDGDVASVTATVLKAKRQVQGRLEADASELARREALRWWLYSLPVPGFFALGFVSWSLGSRRFFRA